MNPVGKDRLPADGAALLEWINSLPISEKVSSLNSLNDGHIIWEVLHHLDPTYFVGNLPEGRGKSGNWVLRWQNLKQISKSLLSYVRECGRNLPQGPGWGDIKLIAVGDSTTETIKAGLEQNGSAKQYTDYTIQLLKLVLIAVVSSPDNENFVRTLQYLSETSQKSVKKIIEDLEDDPPPTTERETSLENESISPLKLTMDRELLLEESLGKATAMNDTLTKENKELQKQLKSYDDRLERLQENNDTLQSNLTEAVDELKQKASAAPSRGEMYIKDLERKIKEQEDLIANQEIQLFDYNTSKENMQKNEEKLQKSEADYQALQDKFDVLRIDRDEQARKANTVDKYKQKALASSDLERQNQLVRGEVDEIREQLKEYEEAAKQVTALKKMITEYETILPRVEQDRHDLKHKMKQLEIDNAELSKRYDAATAQHAKDQERIIDLMDAPIGLDSPRTSGANGLGSLDEELESSKTTVEEEQVADLKNKNRQLARAVAAADMHASSLDQKLEKSTMNYRDLEHKYFESYQDKLALESSLTELTAGKPMEALVSPPIRQPIHCTHEPHSTEIYKKLRKEIEKHKQFVRELTAQNHFLEKQLREAQLDRRPSALSIINAYTDEGAESIVGKDELNALQEVKKFNTQELELQQEEIANLNERIALLEIDLSEKNMMLRSELLTRKRKSSGEDISSGHLQSTLDEIKAAIGQPFDSEPSIDLVRPSYNEAGLEEYMGGLAQKIVKTRERLALTEEQIESQTLVIKELRERLKQAEAKPSSTAPDMDNQVRKVFANILPFSADTMKTILKQKFENLERENRLMATAFHDLSSRLQMSNVTLARRTEAKGFLNRQRYAVNQATAVRSK
ncbi:hypothetical protein MMC17_008589 [Xylographa soralifera]|nr:hypothetical protein [Xylographa soralifera]